MANGLNSFIETINWALLGNTIAAYFSGALDFILSAITTFNWGGAISALFTVISNFITGINWKDLGSKVSGAAKHLFGSIGEGIRNVDWEKLGQQLWTAIKDFFTNIDWGGIADELFRTIGNALAALGLFLWGLFKDAIFGIGEYFGDKINEAGGNVALGILKGIADVFINIGTWVYEHIFKPFINGFKEMFGIHSPSSVMVEMGKFIMQGLLNGVSSLVQTVVGLFTSLWEGIKNVWSAVAGWFDSKVITPLKNAFKGGINFLIGLAEGFANGFIKAINFIINALNKINFDIPDWIPGIGGKTFGINIPNLSEIKLPRLATGGLINAPTVAMIGERGREAVLPLDQNTGWADILAEKLAEKLDGVQSGGGDIIIQADATLGPLMRLLRLELIKENSRAGYRIQPQGGLA